MNYLVILIIFAFNLPSNLFAQSKICINNLDTNKVIRIAKHNKSWWTKAWQFKPSISFKEENCEWVVVCHKIKITNKGDCKYSNGCTITTQVTLLIDAEKGKVKNKIKLKHVTRNFE